MTGDKYLIPWRTPAPYHDDEDPDSLAVRMAQYGAMEPSRFLQMYIKDQERHGVLAQLAPLKHLMSISGAGDKLLPNSFEVRLGHAATYFFRGIEIGRDKLSNRKRVAPGMLKADGDEPYLRIGWRFAFLPCDVATGEVLIDRCPNCRCVLDIFAPRIAVCDHCRHDLRRVEPSYVSEQTLADCRVLAEAVALLPSNHPGDIPLPHAFVGAWTLDEQILCLCWCVALVGRLTTQRHAWSTRTAYEGMAVVREWNDVFPMTLRLLMRQASGDHPASDAIDTIGAFASELRFGKVSSSIINEARAVLEAMGSGWKADDRKNTKRKWVNV